MTNRAQSMTADAVREMLMRPLWRISGPWLAAVLVCLAVVGAAGYAWSVQLSEGMGVSGLRRPTYWGLYIVNFVFWVGISHAGTLISAILRLTDAAWRRPVTRVAEAITLFSLMIAGLFPVIHLGRAWLFYWLIPYPNDRLLWPNFRSPLFWDMTAIMTYVSASALFLYLPMIPDFAMLAERSTGFKSSVYRALSLGWIGDDRQWHALERAMKIFAGVILAVAISVHSVVAFDFAMGIAPMWHSTIFAPYFVAGAIFSGIAALILVMAALRRTLRLDAFLHWKHFNNLGKLLLTMCVVWLYFTASEYLTAWYGNHHAEMAVFNKKVSGEYAPWFWTMVVCNFFVPFILIGVKKLRNIPTLCVSSVCILLGMWIERFLIVVPTLETPHLAAASGRYDPSWVELTITAGTFAAMILLYLLFSKLVPIIAVWEYEHDSLG